MATFSFFPRRRQTARHARLLSQIQGRIATARRIIFVRRTLFLSKKTMKCARRGGARGPQAAAPKQAMRAHPRAAATDLKV